MISAWRSAVASKKTAVTRSVAGAHLRARESVRDDRDVVVEEVRRRRAGVRDLHRVLARRHVGDEVDLWIAK